MEAAEVEMLEEVIATGNAESYEVELRTLERRKQQLAAEQQAKRQVRPISGDWNM
mgnify:CR=1 FL=1